MPARQSGSVVKRGKTWAVRWYDEHDYRKFRGGFSTKSEAREWVDRQVDEVAARRRGEMAANGHRPNTVDQLLDMFLDRHGATVDPATKRKLEQQLKHARGAFAQRHPDSLNRLELEDWRQTLSPGSRHDVFRAFRQALSWAASRALTTRDATVGVRNPKRKRHERRDVFPFETWTEVEAVADELDPRFRAIPVVAVGTGLRPEELFGLDRADVDRDAGVLHVRRRFTQGVLKEGGKTDGSTRTVPLRRRVLEALDAMPRRIDTPVLFPAPRGGRIDGEKFRHREWAPALRAAGLTHRRVYDCRHTFATWSLESGVEVLYLARIMGTSVAQIEDTYARWLSRTDEQLRGLLDAYDSAAEA
jgi:integrase